MIPLPLALRLLPFVILSFLWSISTIALSIPSATSEYFGVRLGTLRNATHGISGQVWLANTTAIQITHFRLDKDQKHESVFAFSSGDQMESAKSVYKVVRDANGEEVLIQMKKYLEMGGDEELRLVVIVPAGKSARDWKQIGVANAKTLKYLAAVPIDKPPPEPFCCIRNPEQPERGIIGEQYSAGTGQILVEDAKTIVLNNITLEANRAPDAWVFAGNGEVRQSSGKKALVVGRDTPQRHCSLRDQYRGDTNLRARLADLQNIYTIDYLSLFCYQYDVDFGHISVKLDPKQNPVPAFIPPIGGAKQGNKQQLSGSAGELDVLESNDIDGNC